MEPARCRCPTPQALKANEQNAKAWFRRGQAFRGLGQPALAYHDFIVSFLSFLRVGLYLCCSQLYEVPGAIVWV